jgi:hypothetical protein
MSLLQTFDENTKNRKFAFSSNMPFGAKIGAGSVIEYGLNHELKPVAVVVKSPPG